MQFSTLLSLLTSEGAAIVHFLTLRETGWSGGGGGGGVCGGAASIYSGSNNDATTVSMNTRGAAGPATNCT